MRQIERQYREHLTKILGNPDFGSCKVKEITVPALLASAETRERLADAVCDAARALLSSGGSGR